MRKVTALGTLAIVMLFTASAHAEDEAAKLVSAEFIAAFSCETGREIWNAKQGTFDYAALTKKDRSAKEKGDSEIAESGFCVLTTRADSGWCESQGCTGICVRSGENCNCMH